jgi:hypothetical protein
MRYSFFLALGMYVMLLGAQCWLLDSVVLRKRNHFFAGRAGPPAQVRATEIIIPDWAPSSLMGLGIVLVIYSHTIPKWLRNAG